MSASAGGSPPVSSSSMSKLALQILKQAFGDVTKDVARYIMNSEECTLFSLKIHFESCPESFITINEIRDAIAVLIQHNFIKVELPPDNDEYDNEDHLVDADPHQQTGLIYSMNIDEIINRLRLPQLLIYATNTFGIIGQCIIEELAVHGRLRRTEIINNVKLSVRKIVSDEAADMETLKSEDDDESSFSKSIFFKYLHMDDVTLEQEITHQIDGMAIKRCLRAVQKLHVPKRERIIDQKLQALAQMTADAIANRKPSAGSSNAALSSATSNKRKKGDSNTLEEEKPSLANARKRAALAASVLAQRFKAVSSSSSSSINNTAANDSEDDLPIELRSIGKAKTASNTTSEILIKSESNAAASMDNSFIIVKNTTKRPEFNDSRSSSNIKNEGRQDSNNDRDLAYTEGFLTIGWDQIIRHSRHALCISICTERLGQMAANIVRVIMSNSMNAELTSREDRSSSMTLQEICEALNTNKQKKIDLERTKSVIDLMLTDIQLKILQSDTTGSAVKYFVTMREVVSYVKKKAIHKIAYERYDNYAARIVELLHRHSYMEQQQIGDLAIMPVRDARQRLYRLYRDKWVGYLELSKRNDFSPSSTYYFWHLDKPRLDLAILDDMYKTVLNMMIRRDCEMAASESELNIAKNEGHRFGKIFDKIRQLNYSIMKVDQTILLFSRF